MRTIDFEQGSPEWHLWRCNKRMASETPAVTRRSPYQTWDALRKVKNGELVKQTAAMAHGHKFEHEARLWAAAETGFLFIPTCVEEGDYAASLDGIDGNSILEVKCPKSGRASDTWKLSEQGLIRPDYDDQIQHQLLVSGADLAYFAVYDAETSRGILIERKPDVDAWKRIQAAWDAFWPWHLTDDPDPAKNTRTDSAWMQAAQEYMAAKQAADRYAKQAEQSRAALLLLAGESGDCGYGVKVSRFEKAGSIDYKKAATEAGLELEPYRKAGTVEARVTIE